MKYSIRSRLTFLITLAYLSVFVFLLIAGVSALYFGLTEEIDKKLELERDQMLTIFKADYLDLLGQAESPSDSLRTDFQEEIEEIYAFKDQFVIFLIEKDSGWTTYTDGGMNNVELLLPKDLPFQDEGFYNQRLGQDFYRAFVSKQEWGTVVVGMEGQTFFEIADQLKDILIVGAPLTLILVVLGGRILAGIAMRPVIEAAEATERITMTNLRERLPEYTGEDEFGELVSTLDRMIARLDQGVNRVQQFTQDAAHELRTPLTTLRGELELAYQQDTLPDDLRAPIQKSLDKAILMNKIVDNLMLLAESDTGNYPIDQKPFRFDELVTEVVDDIKMLVDDRPVNVLLKHCDDITLEADQQLVRRLVLNLCANAVRFTREGSIEVRVRKSENYAELKIDDTGIGIPAEQLPYIFDRFYRVDKARSRDNGGSGLGLAICKWIVDAHNGKIVVDSQVAKGTTVTVSLPLSRSGQKVS